MAEYGYCQCECGGKTKIAERTDKRRGWVEGQPIRFIYGHHQRGPGPGRYQRRPLAEGFWEKVNRDGPMPSPEAVAVHPEIKGERCWLFASSKAGKRYGRIYTDGRQVQAHRAAWYLQTGAWPEPNCLHKCDVRNCVRFSHLFQGTDTDNMQDMIGKKRDRLVGSRNSRAKLTDEQVAEIRRLGQPWLRHPRRRGTALLVRQIARRFGVTEQCIKKILRNELWQENAPGLEATSPIPDALES